MATTFVRGLKPDGRAPETDELTRYIGGLGKGKSKEDFLAANINLAELKNIKGNALAAYLGSKTGSMTVEQFLKWSNLQNREEGLANHNGKSFDPSKSFEYVMNGVSYDDRLNADNYDEYMALDMGEGGDSYVRRSIDDFILDEPDPEPPEDAPPLEPVKTEWSPAGARTGYMKDYFARRELRPGHEGGTNAVLAGLAAGIKLTEKLNRADLDLERKGFDLETAAQALARKHQNSDPQTRALAIGAARDGYWSDERYSPEAGGLTPEERFGRNKMLVNFEFALEREFQKQDYEFAKSTAFADFENNNTKLLDGVRTGGMGLNTAIERMRSGIIEISEYQTPYQINKTFQESYAALGAAALDWNNQELVKKAGGDLINDVDSVMAGYQYQLNFVYGNAAAAIGPASLDDGVFKIKAAAAVEGARKDLLDYNAGVFKRAQADYENAINNGAFDTAAAIAEMRGPQLRDSAKAGAISGDDWYRFRDFFKPVVTGGDGRKSSLSGRNLAEKYAPQIIRFMDNGGYTAAGSALSFSTAAGLIYNDLLENNMLPNGRRDENGYDPNMNENMDEITRELFSAITVLKTDGSRAGNVIAAAAADYKWLDDIDIENAVGKAPAGFKGENETAWLNDQNNRLRRAMKDDYRNSLLQLLLNDAGSGAEKLDNKIRELKAGVMSNISSVIALDRKFENEPEAKLKKQDRREVVDWINNQGAMGINGKSLMENSVVQNDAWRAAANSILDDAATRFAQDIRRDAEPADAARIKNQMRILFDDGNLILAYEDEKKGRNKIKKYYRVELDNRDDINLYRVYLRRDEGGGEYFDYSDPGAAIKATSARWRLPPAERPPVTPAAGAPAWM
jgi:hypothetical protein